MIPVDDIWAGLLTDVLVNGDEVSPRGRRTREIRPSTIVVDMKKPVVTLAERNLGYRFLCAEAAWITSGDDRVETIAPFSKKLSWFSDDGVRFFGAYGPKFRGQLDYVVETLRRDETSRQAYFNIWRENPPISKDVPCTVGCQFMIRNGRLDSFVSMRSNDAWLGSPYDWFSASMWSAYVLLELSRPDVDLGFLYHSANSRHLYEKDWENAKKCAAVDESSFNYAPLDLREFSSGDQLTQHLWLLARGGETHKKWLRELPFREKKHVDTK